MRRLSALLLLVLACPISNGNPPPDEPFCGNGVVEDGEDCDGTADCAADCTFLPPPPDPVCGNGIAEVGEACDGDINCLSDCTARPPVPECPRFAEFPRLCVPLPGAGGALQEVAPNANCGAGTFSTQSIDIRKVADDLIIMKETGDNSGERPVMALFLGQSKALLYDSGNRSINTQDVVAPLLGGRSLDVLNTHLHGDHIGRNEAFASVITIDTPEVRQHCGISSFDANQSAVCNNAAKYQAPNDQVLFANRSFQVTKVVRDGHVIDLENNYTIQVLATPGHSETSITLFDQKHRILFTGDTLYPGNNPALIHPSTGSSFSQYLATAQRYADIEPEINFVIGAHGEGTMPQRSLSALLQLVEGRLNGGPKSFNDPQGCPSGNFSLSNDPAQP